MKHKYIKIYMYTLAIFIMCIATLITHFQEKLAVQANSYQQEIATIKETYEQKITKYEAYEYLYNENKVDLVSMEARYKSLKNEYENFKNSIAYAKSTIKPVHSRGGVNSQLNVFEPITVQELDEWILAKAPEGSPFIGKGNIFIKASQESGLDPKYIVAHAALESGWGTSAIARDKNNFFGIGAYNSSPYKSAKSFKSMEDGIISGAVWISRNYTEQGQDTLSKMIYGKKSYCVTDSGLPDDKWITKIYNIMIN